MISSAEVLGWRPFSSQGRNESDTPPVSGESELTRPFKEYRLPDSVRRTLTNSQLEVLNLLVAAARGVADLYSDQENKQTFAFYPDDTSAKELRDAARENTKILDPYTVVRRDEQGNLVTKGLQEVFKESRAYSRVIRLLHNAASASGRGKGKDSALRIYLGVIENSFKTTGDFKRIVEAWLVREDEPLIDIVIGPYDTNTDELMGAKYAWQAWVGVLDKQLTEESRPFFNNFLAWWQKKTKQEAPNIRMRIEHTRIRSGQAERYQWIANNLPCQSSWRQKFGSKFTVLEPEFNSRFDREYQPAFRNCTGSRVRRGISGPILKRASLRAIIAHEITHSLIPNVEDLHQRLGSQANWAKELYCDLMAITGYSQIEGLKPLDREPEVALGVMLSAGRFDYTAFMIHRERQEYLISMSIILKHLLNRGSVGLEHGQITWDNHDQIVTDLSELFKVVEQLLAQGTAQEAQTFLQRHYAEEVYQQVKNPSSRKSYLKK